MSSDANCPFCDSKPQLEFDDTTRVIAARCTQPPCPLSKSWVPITVWNRRPIEDALRKRLEAAKTVLNAVRRTLALYHRDSTPTIDNTPRMTVYNRLDDEVGGGWSILHVAEHIVERAAEAMGESPEQWRALAEEDGDGD